MYRVARTLASTVVAAAALVAPHQRAFAQLDTTHTWRFNITPYLWLAELNGRVGVGPVASSVSLSSSDILDNLKFGAMATAEARYGPWLIAADGMYVLLGAGRAFGFRGDTGSLSLNQSQTTIQPMGGYTFGDGDWAVDVLGSMRIWKLSAALAVNSNTRPPDSHSAARTWVDATPGFRFRWKPLDDVRFVFYADGGLGGSQNTWQIYSSLGYDFWKGLSVGISYRELAVDYDRNNFLYDTTMQGLLFGLAYRFP
jgi:hypothetical protein